LRLSFLQAGIPEFFGQPFWLSQTQRTQELAQQKAANIGGSVLAGLSVINRNEPV
jgi:hypothetical protein